MTRTNGKCAARCRNAIVTVAIAVVMLCGGRASAWAASNGPPAASEGAGTSAESSHRGASPPATTAPTLADRYADRETNARDLEKFQGGDIVIIGSGGAILVLLIIILLITL